MIYFFSWYNPTINMMGSGMIQINSNNCDRDFLKTIRSKIAKNENNSHTNSEQFVILSLVPQPHLTGMES
jgi:hypothetical protein